VSAGPGEKVFGSAEIGESPVAKLSLPVGIINGEVAGPTIAVVAGEHPLEFPGIDAAIRIFKDIEPQDLRGCLIIVPVSNILGFERYHSYTSPLDGLNMAFEFPGDVNGTFSRVSNYHLEKIVYRADYFVDLHGAEINELLIPYSIYYKTGNKDVDLKMKTMANLFDLEYVEERTETGAGKYWPTSAIFVDAAKKGIPSIVAESGTGLGSYNEDDIVAHYNGVTNILKNLHMLEGSPKIVYQTKKLFNDVQVVRAKRGGVFYPEAKLKDRVRRGKRIGRIINLKGEMVEEIAAPVDGFVHMIIPKHVVYTADPVYYLGMNLKELKLPVPDGRRVARGG
jgi:predicted deacylase